MKPIVKSFQKHDLYTKRDECINLQAVEAYYKDLVEDTGEETYDF